MADKEVSFESLKSFVRKEAPRFLKQKNITSIGIGYKIKNGKPTKQISVQFTVGCKLVPENLEAIGATKIPESFIIDGLKVATDVVQRSYHVKARSVDLLAKQEAASLRKSYVNPISPGVSIGHPSITAGTAGCVVYDAQSGVPYILSNWHVLNGPSGKIGDKIVQPGTYDDNRTDRNVAGNLVRSYLGIAGDCAIASIDKRKLVNTILDLGVTVEKIGEPELGDHVIKSGRTTDVTYGIVSRIHVTTRLNYDNVGDQEIGCFEIGPDPKHPANNGEISMGGDSGSAWLHANKDKATEMMLGLHFAGEYGDQPEYALACYPASVFEKLEILPSKPTEVKAVRETAIGYNSDFIGVDIPLPKPANQEILADLLDLGGQTQFDYTHFSLVLSKSRRFARWVAWNVDGASLKKISRNGIKFKKDPNIPDDAQVGNELYADNQLDRGHIARRADLVWGPMSEARRANIDSFFYTNITPQHASFNQSDANGIWGELENAIFSEVEVNDLHITVMGGPIFSDMDPIYRGVRLPKQFWKVLYFREVDSDEVIAKGYVLSQIDLLNNLEVLELPEFSVYELPISQIGEITGLSLPQGAISECLTLPKSKGLKSRSNKYVKIRRIESSKEILG